MTATLEELPELTADELRAAIGGFDAATQLRLQELSRIYSQGRGIEPDDLLNKAVVKSLSGERSCPRSVPVPVFLWNTMRSLASSEFKKKQNSVVVAATSTGDEGCERTAVQSRGLSLEEEVLQSEAEGQIVAAMDRLFSEDPEAQLVVNGLCQEMTREEIQGDCNLSNKAYDTIRRRIRRKLNKRYPKGWKS